MYEQDFFSTLLGTNLEVYLLTIVTFRDPFWMDGVPVIDSVVLYS